ncbi:hypothetical protein C8R48DRAFT_672094 [Suillus tomentosus]|nr:hypothetical protein C8R48DRAFT_672094 [Suillus tomentosus]
MASLMDVDPCDTLPYMVPVSAADNEHSESEPAAPALSGHLDQMIRDCTFRFDEGPLDLFAELEAMIASGGYPSQCRLPQSTTSKNFWMTARLILVLNSLAMYSIMLLDDIYERTNTKDAVSLDNATYPWPSKAHFMTSLLFSSPCLPFSDAQKRAVLSWAQQLGARDVPSLGAIKKSQKYLDSLVSDPTEKVTARSGNVFYINDVVKSIAKDYANPLTRFAMQDYPKDSGEEMSQVFNGKKMLLDLPSPPAARVDGIIYFTDSSDGDSDPCEQPDGRALYALGWAVERTEVPSSSKYATLSPNPLREKSNGRMVHTVPLLVLMDDVSGNISKQWNKHHAIYMSNANLPREMLEKEFFVRFVTSSPHAAPMELMRAMKESICNAAESGIITWDCKYNEEVLLIPTCDIGGTKEFKASSDGYRSLFMSGNTRTPEDTTAEIHKQFETAFKSGASEKIKNLVSSTGIRDSASNSILNVLVELGKKLGKRAAGTQALPEAEVTAALEKEFSELLQGEQLNNAINPLLRMEGFDIHMDTPTEILHTILLGVVKYFWGQTVFLLDKAKLMGIFQLRLESVDKNGLNAPCLNADSICHYKGSLIGKHFKSLVQVMPFLIYDLVPSTVLNAWALIGELVVLVWHTKIVHTETYLAKLSQMIQDFLNVTAHNRQAPSRDSCRVFAHQDIIKHIVTGGFWYDNNTSKWVQGGAQILGYLDEHPEQARLLGLSVFNRNAPIPGSGKAQTSLGTNGKTAKDDAVPWKATHCWTILKTAQPDTVYYRGKSVVAREGDVAFLNSHIIFHRVDGQMCVGRVREILLSPEDLNTVVHVGLQLFSFADTLHASINLPCLNLTDDEVVTTAADIICVVNLQHNCVDLQCTDTISQPHKSTPHYFINAYSIHNYDHIHLILPEALRESPLRVTNAAEVREMAVQHMKQKKASKKSGDAPQQDDHMEHDTQIPPMVAPTFNRPPPKSRTTAKSKPKTTASSSRRAKTLKTSQAVAGPSSQPELPSAQHSPMIDHQNHAHFAPPPEFPSPQYYQHLQLPPPQLDLSGGSQRPHNFKHPIQTVPTIFQEDRLYTAMVAHCIPLPPPTVLSASTLKALNNSITRSKI